jgi:MscS family membrane protein
MDTQTYLAALNLLSITVISMIGIIVSILFHFVIKRAEARAVKRDSDIRAIIYHAIRKPGVVLIIAFTIINVVNQLPLHGQLAILTNKEYLYVVYVIVATWFIGVALHEVISLYSNYLREHSPDGRVNNKLVTFFEVTIKYIVWAIALLVILTLLNINVTPLIAAGGFVGIGITLAAQSVLGNLFSGLILAMDQPFKLGDHVQVKEYIGDVLDIGLRSCVLQTSDNRTMVIPNSFIEKEVVINYSVPDPRLKISIPFKIPYGTDIEWVKDLLVEVSLDIASNHPVVLKDPKPVVRFMNFGDYYLNFSLVIWISSSASVNRDAAVDLINCAVLERFTREGINIPNVVPFTVVSS